MKVMRKRGEKTIKPSPKVFISFAENFAEFLCILTLEGMQAYLSKRALVNNLNAFFISHGVLNKQESVINSFN